LLVYKKFERLNGSQGLRFFYGVTQSLNGFNVLKIIPVIDILNKKVVHAVKGQRHNYQPLESTLFKSTEPLEVAKGFKALGFSELYIADLDAIIDCSTYFGFFKNIVDETGLSLLVDAGITSIDRAEKLFESGVSKLVIGTETLQSKNFVAQVVEIFGSAHVVVSLDLKGEKMLVKLGFDGSLSPVCLLKDFKEMGISQVIVLDLTRVGSGEGVNTDFLKKVIADVGVDVYVGGGVRDINDLVELRNLGVSGALIATTLHTGKITIEQLKQEGFL
jgi:phosphoribosylformimino-5-aminoimidazole carboxamide ribotide isomerase